VRTANAKSGNGTTLFSTAHSPYQAQIGSIIFSYLSTTALILVFGLRRRGCHNICERLEGRVGSEVLILVSSIIYLTYHSCHRISFFYCNLTSYLKASSSQNHTPENCSVLIPTPSTLPAFGNCPYPRLSRALRALAARHRTMECHWFLTGGPAANYDKWQVALT
jgi:hypothetical protein